ncbi:DEAD box helicase, putative [Plasmodium sp. gorilla clade G1]|nr:DEAD box helicase, putative [Plasmodium sp. gorilla clade G1]
MENYINKILFLLIFFIFHLNSTKNYKKTYRYIISFLLYFINILYAQKIWGNGKKQIRCCFIKNLYNNNRGIFRLLDNDIKRKYNIIYLKKKNKGFANNEHAFVKNTVFIERGQNDENKINYVQGNFDENVKDIKYLSDMQKNFIYLLERNNNLLVHAKTSSGKTTICLYYLILKFFYNCEFIFKEDIEREEYIMKNDYIDRNIYESKNKSRKYFNQNKYRFIPYSEKYSEISDIKEYTNLMIENKCKTKLKKDEKVLILCPSKELCVQVAQNILSFMNNKNESLIKLFIDKDYKNENKEKQNFKEEECINKMEHIQINECDDHYMHHTNTHSLNNNKDTMDIEENKLYMLEHDNLNEDNSSSKVKKEYKINDNNNNSNNNSNNNNNNSRSQLHHMVNLKGVRYLIGTPTCFRSYLLNLDKENLKNFLQSIKYIFYDEIDKLLPSVSKRSLLKNKKNIKSKTAYLILETLMYINKKNLIFIGCSSTLNRELHRKIFKLLCLNKNNAKKKIYILREKKNLLENKENDGMTRIDNITNLIDIPIKNNEKKKNISEKKLSSSNEHIDDNNNSNNIINDEQEEIENNEQYNLNYYLNEENAFQKYIIKVKLPNTIYHFYHLMTDETYENKIKEIHKIIETFKNQKILILIKNGYSLIQLKKYLEMNNIFAVLLHEKLQISLRYNNDNINNMCEHYEDIKDLKSIPNDDKHTYINKYPIIISSFDSIRGFHINNLDMVLLCNKPKNVNEYIHLCGRVGRRKKIGYSVTLENDKNINIMNNWFNNIKVYFNKLSLKSDPVIDEKINNELENQEKNHLNYVASCILDELQENT